MIRIIWPSFIIVIQRSLYFETKCIRIKPQALDFSKESVDKNHYVSKQNLDQFMKLKHQQSTQELHTCIQSFQVVNTSIYASLFASVAGINCHNTAGDKFADWWETIVRTTPVAARKGTSSVIMLTAWQLWKRRNAIIFDGAQPDLRGLLDTIRRKRRRGRQQEFRVLRRYSHRPSSRALSCSGVQPLQACKQLLSIKESKHKVFPFSQQKKISDKCANYACKYHQRDSPFSID